MKPMVKAERTQIIVYPDANKFAAFPGEWASNFFVDQKGILVRKNYDNKFYIDDSKSIEWHSNHNQRNLTESELDECKKVIDAEAKKNGWTIVWPH